MQRTLRDLCRICADGVHVVQRRSWSASRWASQGRDGAAAHPQTSAAQFSKPSRNRPAPGPSTSIVSVPVSHSGMVSQALTCTV